MASTTTSTTTTTATAPKGSIRIERNVHGVLCVFIAGICIPAKDAREVAEILRSKAGLDAVLNKLDLAAGIASQSDSPVKIKSAKDGSGAAKINTSESERERRNANPDKATIPPMVAQTGEPIKTASDIQAEINPDAQTAPKTSKQEENAADRLPPCCPKCGNSACQCNKAETPLATDTDAEKEALLAECRKRGIKARGMHWMKADKLRQLIADQDWAATKHQEILDKQGRGKKAETSKPTLVNDADDMASIRAEAKALGIRGYGLPKIKPETLLAKIAEAKAKAGETTTTDKPADTTTTPVIAGETTAKVADKPGVFITTATGHDGILYTLYRKDNGEIVARVMGKLANAS